MKSWDVIVIGAGIIGVSLAISLRRQGLRVLVIERGEPGREASHAAAGILGAQGEEIHPKLRGMAQESLRLYPEFVHELEDESGVKVDLREQGTILFFPGGSSPDGGEPLSTERLEALEPALGTVRSRSARTSTGELSAAFVRERSIDPRALMQAAIKAAHHRQIDISSGTEANALLLSGARVTGVQTEKSSYGAAVVVNCAGAWAGSIAPCRFPVRPVKGQMLATIGGIPPTHVLRSRDIYLVPRRDGRVVIGSTLEDAGFNKQTDVNTIQKLLKAALELMPALADAKVHEAWAGLRPGTPDDLPLLGETSIAGYFVASGHYRNGILLAPLTAAIMTSLVLGSRPSQDVTDFRPQRFDP